MVGGKGQLFPDIQGGVAVVQTGHKKVHSVSPSEGMIQSRFRVFLAIAPGVWYARKNR